MDNLTQEQLNILNICRELLKEHDRLCIIAEETGINNDDSEIDELYDRYWYMLHDNFDVEILKKVESRIGHGNFMDAKYIDILTEVVNEQPKKIYKYKDYDLIKGKDCWGNISYVPYKNGRQYSDVFDAYNDDSAIAEFISSIDKDPNSPNFM